jgi:hypothetical protein
MAEHCDLKKGVDLNWRVTTNITPLKINLEQRYVLDERNIEPSR